jgi:hypothetical protein
MSLEGLSVLVCIDQSKSAAEAPCASGVQPCHQLGDDRIFFVAHACGSIRNAFPHAFGNLRAISQGLRDCVLGNPASLRHILHGDWFHVGDITVM